MTKSLKSNSKFDNLRNRIKELNSEVKKGDKLKAKLIVKATKESKSKSKSPKKSKEDWYRWTSGDKGYVMDLNAKLTEDNIDDLLCHIVPWEVFRLNTDSLFDWERETDKPLKYGDIHMVYLNPNLVLLVDLVISEQKFIVARYTKHGNYGFFERLATYTPRKAVDLLPIFRLLVKECTYRQCGNWDENLVLISSQFVKSEFGARFNKSSYLKGDRVELEIDIPKPDWYPKFTYVVF